MVLLCFNHRLLKKYTELFLFFKSDKASHRQAVFIFHLPLASSNHFHLLMKMIPEGHFTDQDIQKRFEAFHGDSREFVEGQIPYWRKKLSNLSEFVREIKVGFARYYIKSKKEWISRYRRYVYEAGAISRPDKMQAKVIDDKVAAKERKKI